MPCRDWEDCPTTCDCSTARAETARVQKKLDKVTKLLCSLCTNVDVDGETTRYMSHEVQKWWKKHQEMDRQRLEAEARNKARKDELVKKRRTKAELRMSALRKLNAAERRALGID